MEDYQKKFHSITDFVHGAAQSVLGKIDHFTFKMLVDQLKSEDYEAAKTAIEQLAKEKRTIGIPPLYFVSQAHPNPRIREKALKAIDLIDEHNKIAELTKGKTTEDAVKALIQEYGHYKQS